MDAASTYSFPAPSVGRHEDAASHGKPAPSARVPEPQLEEPTQETIGNSPFWGSFMKGESFSRLKDERPQEVCGESLKSSPAGSGVGQRATQGCGPIPNSATIFDVRFGFRQTRCRSRVAHVRQGLSSPHAVTKSVALETESVSKEKDPEATNPGPLRSRWQGSEGMARGFRNLAAAVFPRNSLREACPECPGTPFRYRVCRTANNKSEGCKSISPS